MNYDPFDEDGSMDDVTEGEFICPECGSGAYRDHLLVSPAAPDPSDPWSCVCQMYQCGQCWSWVPAHLGRRWGGMSIERSKEEWSDVYRQKGISKRRRDAEANRPRQTRSNASDDGAGW